VTALDERPEPVVQPEEGVTYAEKIVPEDRRLDPSSTADELARTVRALTPHIGAWIEIAGGERLGVRSTRPRGDATLAPGELAVRDSGLLLGTTEGVLELLEVQPPGKRPMPVDDYLRGHDPTGTPQL
jgi:methionyl-tRNA formyltransferase